MDHDTAPRPDARSELGALGEDLAASALRARGYVVLARNWRVATGRVRGELDLVCRDGDTLVVVEVKTRRGRRFGGPLVAVTPTKQARIRALATAFVSSGTVRPARIRFDVVGVVVDPTDPAHAELQHVIGAF